MSEELRQKHSKHPFRKKVLRGVMFVFLSLLFLEFLFYFGSNFILADWARRKINDAAQGVYSIDFNRVRFSLIRRGVFLDGIIMKPIGERKPSQKQALFELTLDELALKKLWFDFSEGIFYIGSIEFDNPNISMDLPKSDSLSQSNKQESSIKALEEEFKKIINRANFRGVYISELSINNADLFFLNFLSHNSLKAENTRLLVKDIDWTKQEEWTTPFNAKGFEFDLNNVDFPLPDGVHSIHADDVYISSLDDVIDIKGFKLYADKTRDSKAYYEVDLQELRVGNVALNEAFMTSNVEIDEIILNNPEFRVLQNMEAAKDSTASGDLNELIEGLLESFQVKELSVNKGKFITSDADDTLKNRIDIQNLDFKMVEFYLGKDESRKENQFFYGKDAAMEIQDADLYLSDEIHVIYGDRVSVSSFKDEIIIENVLVEPREKALEELQPNNIVRISLPKLTLNKANLKKLYSEGKLNIDEMLIQSPKVEITELTGENVSGNQVPVRELLEGYLNEVAIGRFDLQDGEVQFKNEEGVRSNDIGFEKFSLLLEKVFLQPNSEVDVRNQFLADEMVLSLDKYRLKLRDNLHEFVADRVLIDSKNSLVVVNNFSLRPENPDSIQYILDSYGKSVILDLKIPEFRVEGIDLMAAYREQKLMINTILVPSPVASFTRFRKQKALGGVNQVESSDEIEDLLTSYFSYIKIDSVNFSDGQVHYLNHAAAKQLSLSEDSLSLTLKGFYLEKGKVSEQGRTFFSDEIELVLRKYDFSVAGGNYEVDTDGLRFNSKSKTISVDNLKLKPSKSIKSKIALSLNLPSVSFEGVDIESFLFDNQLDLDKLVVDGSTIGLEINRNYKAGSSEKKGSPLTDRTLPKSIERVTIDGIEAKNSRLSLNYRIGENDFESIQTDFDLEILGLNLDSATNARHDIVGLFDEINLTLKDFSYTLPDSIHTIKFSDVYVDNSADETVFSNFEIVPRNTTGSPGLPIVSAKIDKLGVRNNSLQEMQTTGTFNLEQLRLGNPTIKLYLDPDKKADSTKKKSIEESDGGLIESILLQDLLIQHGDISLYTKGSSQTPRMMFENVDFGLKSLDVDFLKKGLELNPQLLLEKDLSLSLTNYHIYTNDSLNKLKIGRIRYLDNNIFLDSVSYGPVVGRYDFLRQRGYQDDAIDAFVKSVSLNDIDFEEYFNNNNLKAHSIILDGFQMDVFRDKRLPLKEGVIKPMPQELMENASLDLTIDSVIVKDGLIRYQEFAPKAMLPGGIRFEELETSIAPFVMRKSNEKFPLKSSTILAKTKLMGEGEIELQIDMHFGKPYPMDVDVEMGEFDLRLLNNMLSRGVFVSVVDGRVTDGKWDFRIDNDAAAGKMNFKYEDLKIEFLDSLTLERGRGKLGLMTFLANIIAKNNNPRKFFNHRVTSDIYFERDKSKFIFGGWWRATFSGLKGSLGLGQPKVPKRKEEEEE
ncbi:hypothetical protein [uncultured Algoriphagus sp.]|uniref:hypothetical protein n=1 Tax=uncultured Algoriphagus sp. TaxID=417365 RepID=UPI0030EDEC36